LGILLRESGKSSEAAAAYQQALKLDPSLNAASDFLRALTADSQK
jgi:Flp pilus assembly protein TadD